MKGGWELNSAGRFVKFAAAQKAKLHRYQQDSWILQDSAQISGVTMTRGGIQEQLFRGSVGRLENVLHVKTPWLSKVRVELDRQYWERPAAPRPVLVRAFIPLLYQSISQSTERAMSEEKAFVRQALLMHPVIDSQKTQHEIQRFQTLPKRISALFTSTLQGKFKS